MKLAEEILAWRPSLCHCVRMSSRNLPQLRMLSFASTGKAARPKRNDGRTSLWKKWLPHYLLALQISTGCFWSSTHLQSELQSTISAWEPGRTALGMKLNHWLVWDWLILQRPKGIRTMKLMKSYMCTIQKVEHWKQSPNIDHSSSHSKGLRRQNVWSLGLN